jgi:hypothetical protein
VVVVCQIQQTYNQSILISRVFCLAQPWRAPRALRQGRCQTSQPNGNPRVRLFSAHTFFRFPSQKGRLAKLLANLLAKLSANLLAKLLAKTFGKSFGETFRKTFGKISKMVLVRVLLRCIYDSV